MHWPYSPIPMLIYELSSERQRSSSNARKLKMNVRHGWRQNLLQEERRRSGRRSRARLASSHPTRANGDASSLVHLMKLWDMKQPASSRSTMYMRTFPSEWLSHIHTYILWSSLSKEPGRNQRCIKALLLQPSLDMSLNMGTFNMQATMSSRVAI